MGATTRTRSAALLIAVLAMAGFVLPALVAASIVPPSTPAPSGYQVKPTDLPTPKPKPTPTPIATPTPAPTPAPTAPPTPAPTRAPTPRPPTPAPTAAPTTGPTPTRTPAPPASATNAPDPAATPGAGGSSATATPDVSDVPGGVLGDGGPGGPERSGGLVPTSGSDRWLTDVAVPIGYLVLVLVVALVIARRRLERSERAALAGAAQGRAALDPDSRPVRRIEPRARPAVADDEENRPRWLRPSLRAERAGLDLGPHRRMPIARLAPPPARAPLAFGGVPAELDERRVVRAVGAALLDQPDDATGRRLLELEPGDEVAIIDRDGAWVNALTPTGEAGWLPETALEVATSADRRATPAAPPIAGTVAPASSPFASAIPPEEPLDHATILAAGRAAGPAPRIQPRD